MFKKSVMLCLAGALLMPVAGFSANEFSTRLTERLNTFVDSTLSVFPDNTPGKPEVLAITSKMIEIASLPVQGAEKVPVKVEDWLLVLAAESRRAYEDFEQTFNSASSEFRTVVDTVFVSTSGKITYEGTDTGVPGVVVVQGVPGSEGMVTIGLSITDFQGEYKIIYPGSIIALLDDNNELNTVVRPIFDIYPSTPGSWQVSYDADGVLTRVQVP